MLKSSVELVMSDPKIQQGGGIQQRPADQLEMDQRTSATPSPLNSKCVRSSPVNVSEIQNQYPLSQASLSPFRIQTVLFFALIALNRINPFFSGI